MLHKGKVFVIAALIVSIYPSYAADTAFNFDDLESNESENSCLLVQLPDFKEYFAVGSFDFKDEQNIDELLFWKYVPERRDILYFDSFITCVLLKGPTAYIKVAKELLLLKNNAVLEYAELLEERSCKGCWARGCLWPGNSQRTFDSDKNDLGQVMKQVWQTYIEVEDDEEYQKRVKDQNLCKINSLRVWGCKKQYGLPKKVDESYKTYSENSRSKVVMTLQKYDELIREDLQKDGFEGHYMFSSKKNMRDFRDAVKQVMGYKPTGWVLVEEEKGKTIKPPKKEASEMIVLEN